MNRYKIIYEPTPTSEATITIEAIDVLQAIIDFQLKYDVNTIILVKLLPYF